MRILGYFRAFETLDDDMIGLVRSGVISNWSAQRILIPLARANRDHARQLIDALKVRANSLTKNH